MLKATLNLTTSFFGLNPGGAAEQVFEGLLSALGKNPEPAAERLAEALGEVEKMLTALDAELVRFLVLDFSSPDVAREDLKALVELSAGQARVNIEKARGHCSMIKLIYETHLEGWLSNALNSSDQNMIRPIFDNMQGADDVIIYAAEQVDRFLSENAEEVLSLLAQNRHLDAQMLIAEARDDTLPTRRELFANMAILRRYEAAFRRAAKLL